MMASGVWVQGDGRRTDGGIGRGRNFEILQEGALIPLLSFLGQARLCDLPYPCPSWKQEASCLEGLVFQI